MTAKDRHRDTRDITRGALVNFVGALTRSLSVVLAIVLGRLYGAEVTGLFLLCLSAVDTTSKLGILGLDRGVLSKAAREHAEGNESGLYRVIGQALLLSISLSLVVAVGLVCLAPVIAKVLFTKPELVGPMRLMACALPFWGASAVLLFATRALRIMRYEVYARGCGEPLVLLLLAIALGYTPWGVRGLAMAVVAAAAAGSALAAYFFSREFSLLQLWRSLPLRDGRRSLLAFAAPIGFYDLLNQLLQRIDIFLVARFLPGPHLGAYAIAHHVSGAVKKIRQAFDPIFIPVISGAHQKRDQTSMAHHYRNVTRWVLILEGAAVGAVILAREPLMAVFGPDFLIGASALAILTFAVAINCTLGVSELFILIDKPLINLANTVGTLGLAFALNAFLIPLFGMEGAALAMMTTMLCMNAARLLEVAALYKLHPFTWYHGKAFAAFGLALAGAAAGRHAAAGASGYALDLTAACLFVLLYGALLLGFRLAPIDHAAVCRWFGRKPVPVQYSQVAGS